MSDKIIFFGGSNVDYIGKSVHKLVLHDSNIGGITISYGGVGRNVVENLARLGNDVTFITGVGDDIYGKHLILELEALGVIVYHPKMHCGSSSYLAIHDVDGDMLVALCDSKAVESLSISYIKKHDTEIRKRDLLCMDANLSENTIANLFHVYPDKKWAVEAVSTNKVVRYSKYLSSIYLFKGNVYEARTVVESDTEDIRINIEKILKAGVKNAVITNGSKDVWYGTPEGIFSIPVKPINDIVNATGAGDAMFAGIIDKINMGASLTDAIKFGMDLSDLTLESEKSVSPCVEQYRYNHNS